MNRRFCYKSQSSLLLQAVRESLESQGPSKFRIPSPAELKFNQFAIQDALHHVSPGPSCRTVLQVVEAPPWRGAFLLILILFKHTGVRQRREAVLLHGHHHGPRNCSAVSGLALRLQGTTVPPTRDCNQNHPLSGPPMPNHSDCHGHPTVSDMPYGLPDHDYDRPGVDV